MCRAGDPISRCSRGCLRSKNGGSYRGKREAASETARHFISQGPLRLRGSTESSQGPGKNRRGLHPRCRAWGATSDRVPLSRSPEPEPGVRRRVYPGGSGHDQRSGGVQNQDVRRPLPASAHAGGRCGPVKQPAPSFHPLLPQWLWFDCGGAVWGLLCLVSISAGPLRVSG